MTLSPLGDCAVVLRLGEVVDEAMVVKAQALAAAIAQRRLAGVVDIVPAFASVTVFYENARVASFAAFCAELEAIVARADSSAVGGETREVEIPVEYGGEAGPDLDEVALHAGLSPAAVVALHTGAAYRVHAIGFAPGFAYLGGLPAQLETPRRSTPRPLVPAGTVGIGGNLTGVYPLATPGGWNLLGRTPLALFDPARAEPALLRGGDRVRFRAISREDFVALKSSPPSDAKGASPTRRFRAARRSDSASGRQRVEVLRPGMLTTVQDNGRRGQRAAGVPLSGGVDSFAGRLANLLVGNVEDAAVLECTLVGPELRFKEETWIAIAGAEFSRVRSWRPVHVAAGGVVRLGHAVSGCRGYLAIAGGFDVAEVLGSRSTYIRAGLGGLDGRALSTGDVLTAPLLIRQPRGRWHIDPRILPHYGSPACVRVVTGAQAPEFGAGLFDAEFRVAPQSDRMGARLTGPALERRSAVELGSQTVVPGTVQVPPDGQPIVLLADAQTIGGYPQIAHVISVDLPLIAQLRPGDAVRFREVTLSDAHALALARARALAMLREGLAAKFA